MKRRFRRGLRIPVAAHHLAIEVADQKIVRPQARTGNVDGLDEEGVAAGQATAHMA